MNLDLAKQKYESIVEKRREAGKHHRGNQYTRMKQMEQMEQVLQNGTNGTDNDNDNESINRHNISSPKVEDSSAETADDEECAQFKVKELMDFWNESFKNHPNISRLECIKNTRLRMTKARIAEHGKVAFAKAIRNAAASSFITSGEMRAFNYDWFIKPNNFVKVLEDIYKDKEPEWRGSNPRTFSFDEAKSRYSDGDRTLCWAGEDIHRQIITTIDEAVRCGLPYQPFKPY